MSHRTEPQRAGAVWLALAGALLFGSDALLLPLGAPPPQDFAAWVARGELWLALANECLGIGACILIPGLHALFRRLDAPHDLRVATARGVLLATVPLLWMLCVIQGRLVYPVFGVLTDGNAQVRLLLALHWGGMHMVRMAWIVALWSLSAALNNRALRAPGIVWGLLTAAAAYPDRLPPQVALLAQAGFPLWCMTMAAWLWKPAAAPDVAPER